MRVAFSFLLLGKNVTDDGWPVGPRIKLSRPLSRCNILFFCKVVRISVRGRMSPSSDPGKEQPCKALRICSTDLGCSLQNFKMKACGPSNRSLVGVKPLKYSRRDQYFNIAYILSILGFVVGLRPYPFHLVGPDPTFRCPVACI